MRVLFLSCVLALVVILVACGDEPAGQARPVLEPSVQQQGQEAVAQDAVRPGDVDEAAKPQAEPVAEAEAAVETSQEAEAVELEGQSAPADQAELENVDSEDPEPEQEEPALRLTDVAATVVLDADVRIRPELAWRVSDRLESGAAVAALHQAGGWVRIRYGDGLEGWIRVPALDLGDVEEDQILEQAATPLIAEWRGAEYGVMGQSADGAEVRLLQVVDERPMVIGAPIDEVRLIDADVTLEDLPILVADETVVFPGDDFRVGQGKILPRANEWMWLPWGWLLAHNDTHIWQWRPETDELEMFERPQGYAKLSPDGRYLAIENLCAIPVDDCDGEPYAIILPLDGSAPVSAIAELHRLGLDRDTTIRSVWMLGMQWAADSRAVGIFVDVWAEQGGGESILVMHLDGRLVLFDQSGDRLIGELKCGITPPFPGGSNNPWWIDGNTIIADGGCIDKGGERESGDLVFTFGGEFLGVRDASDWWIPDRGAELIRSAEGGDRLSDYLQISWSDADQNALVVDLVFAKAWIYDASLHLLREVQIEGDTLHPSGPWLAPEQESDARQFLLRANWHNSHVVAVITQPYVIRAAWLIDAAAGTGAVLDLGGLSFYNLSPRPVRDWNQSGSVYYIFSKPSIRADGLSVGAGRIPNLLLFERSGDLRGSVNVASTCRDSVVSFYLRDRAEWSPDGELFAIGGIVQDGQRSCPD